MTNSGEWCIYLQEHINPEESISEQYGRVDGLVGGRQAREVGAEKGVTDSEGGGGKLIYDGRVAGGRIFFVVACEQNYNMLNSGIPQGTVLGLLLF